VIVISLVFFLLGVGLLAAGLVIESIQLELGAVASAMVSALALYAGVRQRRTTEAQAADPPGPAEAWKAPLVGPPRGRDLEGVWSPPPAGEPWPTDPSLPSVPIGEASTPPAQEPAWGDTGPHATSPDQPPQAEEPVVSDEPPGIAALDDEPDEEEVSPANVARVAARSDDVLVVDGRPRYHRRACSSLIGRDTVPLPVSEAREAGFTPCGRCRPDAHLLGGMKRPQRR